MKKVNLLLSLSAFALVGGMLTSCGGSSADETLVVYNWEDYIDEGFDDDGNPRVDEEGNEVPSVIAAFEAYYEKAYGKTVHVDYETFQTNEDMYNQVKNGSISPDLICPSDYMIQKMAAEDMLESFGYDQTEKAYTAGLDNFNDYGSPYIKNLFDGNGFSDFAVPYFWGTMGVTYDPEHVDPEDTKTWDILWNSTYSGKITVKNSVRDTYFTALMHVYKDELIALKGKYVEGLLDEKAYNDAISEIFNRCGDEDLRKAKDALVELKNVIKGLEVDDGKNDIIDGNIWVNLAWSGDSVYSMDEAENAEKYLNYSVPEEGSNVWFDGWCMPKGANTDLAKEFVNFLCDPEVAAQNMNITGYTSPIAGDAIWSLANEWYGLEAYENEDGTSDYTEEDCDTIDLSYFFEGTLKEGTDPTILVPTEERGRQFDAQFPTKAVINRCAVMKDFGSQTSALNQMWADFKALLS